MRPALRLLLLAAAAATLAGCNGVSAFDPALHGPFHVPTNHAGDPTLGAIRRVVVLPLAAGALAPVETAALLDPVLISALQGENRFEVVSLSREECRRRFQVAEVSSAAALPHGFLTRLRDDFAADAVLFVDLTVFSPYRPVVVGLRGKLAAIDGSRLVWTFDNVFAADDPAVANSVRRHFLTGDRGGVPVDLTPGVLQSPTRFAGYAAAAMFATLPPVAVPLAAAQPGRRP